MNARTEPLAQHPSGDPTATKDSLEEALRLDPKYATAHSLLGSMLAGEGPLGGCRRALSALYRG